MSRRLTTAEVASSARCHVVTVRRALEVGDLHGVQRGAGGRWTVLEECIDPWLAGEPCAHRRGNVVPLAAGRRRA